MWPPKTLTLRPPLQVQQATDRDAYKFIVKDEGETRERRARGERRGDD